MLRISQIKISLEEDKNKLKDKIIKLLRIPERDLIHYSIFKESIDARRNNKIHFVYTVDVEIKNEQKVLKKCKNKNVTISPSRKYQYVLTGQKNLSNRPVVIGTGPAGLFAGLILAQMGYRPLLLERGKSVEERTKDVKDFWISGHLKPESNVQFGEGGAGTFSDGKLTTLIKDKKLYGRKVLEEFVEAGAPEEILYKNKPHIGTDILQTVVKNIREKIIGLGGEVRFNSKVTSFLIDNKKITGVLVDDNEFIATDIVILAIGHSARDTFQMIYEKNLEIHPKSFSIGVRIEHPQSLIDQAQFGAFSDHPKLRAADYKLSHHCSNGRSVYTFCMCPGGVVVAAASEERGVVTNGMSEYARDQVNANSALLVSVNPNDFETSHPLAGVEFQRKWERKAFEIGGSSYKAPAQLIKDFLNNRPSKEAGEVKPSYMPQVVFSDLQECLPQYIIDAMKEGILQFDQKLQGFAMGDAVMTGVETRSSSPIRIQRDDEFESNIKGIYPAGEGAGYAGGIVSAAVDGIKVAERIITKYKPL